VLERELGQLARVEPLLKSYNALMAREPNMKRIRKGAWMEVAMTPSHKLAGFAIAVLGLLGPITAFADVEVVHDFMNEGSKTIKDLVFVIKKPAGAKITGVTDKDGFATGNVVDDNMVKFDGGSVAKDQTVTVKYTVNVEPDVTTHKESYADNGARSSDNGALVFAEAVYGGALGTTFAGVPIPAGQYGYFYQFTRNPVYPTSPDQFTVAIGSTPPTSVGVLPDTWPSSLLVTDQPDITVFDGSVTYQFNDHMVPAFLTGAPGIMPISWLFSNGVMVADFTSTFLPGDTSDVLWFTDPLPPELGGPLGLGGNNVSLLSGGSLEFATSEIAPTIPEGSSAALLGTALLILVAAISRHSSPRRIQRDQRLVAPFLSPLVKHPRPVEPGYQILPQQYPSSFRYW